MVNIYQDAIRIGSSVVNFSHKVNVAVRTEGKEATFRIYPWRRSSAPIWEECREVAQQISDIVGAQFNEDRFGFIIHTQYLI